MRITNSVPRRRKKKKILELAKGFYGRKKNCYALAIDMIRRKLKYEYRDRKKRKSQMRAIWITRISAAAKDMGTSYSALIHKLKVANCPLNRKMLSEIAARDMDQFRSIVNSY
jgi:large subunit ribosomal protein L20